MDSDNIPYLRPENVQVETGFCHSAKSWIEGRSNFSRSSMHQPNQGPVNGLSRKA